MRDRGQKAESGSARLRGCCVKHSVTLTIPPWGTRTLHFHSKFAGRLGGSTNCVSPNATDIYIAGSVIHRDTLAHEWGHGEAARKRGMVGYLAWIIGRFVSQGYAGSKAEREADEWAAPRLNDFPAEVRCDDDK